MILLQSIENEICTFIQKNSLYAEAHLGHMITTSQAVQAVVSKYLPDNTWMLCHDSSGAPYVMQKEIPTIFHLSLTDEDSYTGAVLAIAEPHSSLLGIGIDIASEEKFVSSVYKYKDLFFTPFELEYLESLPDDDKIRMGNVIFSLKESAIKSLADIARPAILNDPFRYDMIDFRQFEIRIHDANYASITPLSHASFACQELEIHNITGIYFVADNYAVSVVKTLY